MGLFSKAPKPNARIKVGNIVVEFDREHEWWSFEFEGNDFISYGVALEMPSEKELQTVVGQVEKLKGEMKSRISKGLDGLGCEGEEAATGEYTINIENLARHHFFEVSWSGDKWGDIGVDFEINETDIVSESGGD